MVSPAHDDENLLERFIDSIDQHLEAARQEEKENLDLIGGLGSLTAIGLGMWIFGRSRAGGNLIAELMHHLGTPSSLKSVANRTMARRANIGRTANTSGGSPGPRTIDDAWYDVANNEVKLDDLDLIRDLNHSMDLRGITKAEDVPKVIDHYRKRSIFDRFIAKPMSSFFGHNLERITAGEVLNDSSGFWKDILGRNQIETLKKARASDAFKHDTEIFDKLILDKRVFRTRKGARGTGKILDTRLPGIKKAASALFDPFGQSGVIKDFFGKMPRYKLLPPNEGSERFFIDGTILTFKQNAIGRSVIDTIETGRALKPSGGPTHLVSALREGVAEVTPAEGRLSGIQNLLGIGPHFATRRSFWQKILVDPFTRYKALRSGKATVYKHPKRYKGAKYSGEFYRTMRGGASPEVGVSAGRATEAVPGSGGGGEVNFFEMGWWSKLGVLTGMKSDIGVYSARAVRDNRAIPQRLLTNADLIIPMPRGGVKGAEKSFRSRREAPGRDVRPTLTAAGQDSSARTARYYDVKAGGLEKAKTAASYLGYRLGSLISETIGMSFRPSGSALKNWGGVIGIELARRSIMELAGYADFAIEDVTGVSPYKVLAGAYANLRIGQQAIREATGLTTVAASSEDLLPGSVDSGGSLLLRSVVAPLAGMMAVMGRKGSLGKVLATGAAIFGVVGGASPAQSPEQLSAEYAGTAKVPVRKGALWGLGNQPFFGGDITHYEHSWYHKITSDYYTKSVYGSRSEYYSKYANVGGVPLPNFHNAFGIRNLFNLYGVEKKHYYDRPYAQTAGMFDEFPIIGTALSETLGALIKPRMNMHVAEMSGGETTTDALVEAGKKVANSMLPEVVAFRELYGVPLQSANVIDRFIPGSAASRLGIADLPARGVPYNSATSLLTRMREQAAIASEPLGIYKWIMQQFGVGGLDAVGPNQMADSGTIASAGREFYNRGLGGLFGQTEWTRRFFLSEKNTPAAQRQMLNPIRNAMPTWLPGYGSEVAGDESYFLDLLHGDPYAKIEGGEGRLPGAGYEAISPLHSGTPGKYDAVDRMLILADVAPYSRAYQQYKNEVGDPSGYSGEWGTRIEQAIQQRETVVDNLLHYPRGRSNPENVSALNEMIKSTGFYKGIRAIWDVGTHDLAAETPYFGSKLAPFRSAIERYEKEEIYGDTFSDWSRPWDTIARPAMYDMARSNPILAAYKGAVMGGLMSTEILPGIGGSYLNPVVPMRNPLIAIPVMAGIGAATSTLSTISRVFGDLTPEHRQSENVATEYMDKVAYLKARTLQGIAEEVGDSQLASSYGSLAKTTLVGADSDVGIRSALSSRDRRYFNTFMNTPEGERPDLISRLPKYYAESLEKAWSGKYADTRQADDATLSYFRHHRMPDMSSLMWHPSVPIGAMKIKMIEGGVNGVSDNLHRFGFYESQKVEVNNRFPDLRYTRGSTAGLFTSNFSDFRANMMQKIQSYGSVNGASVQLDSYNDSVYGTNMVIRANAEDEDKFYYMRDVLR